MGKRGGMWRSRRGRRMEGGDGKGKFMSALIDFAGSATVYSGLHDNIMYRHF